MKQKTSPETSGISKWLLTAPLKFAVIVFIALIAIILATELIANAFTLEHTYTIYATLITLAMVGGATIMIRGLPHTDLSRQRFIAIINAQTLILATIFVVTTLFFVANNSAITIRILMLSHHGGMFAWCVSCVVMFFLYVTGMSIAAVYAKFRRARAIGIPTWKIICSMPFGFSMTWVPGYLVPDVADASCAGTDPYSRMTHFIVTRPAATVVSFTVLTLMSGLFFGINMMLLTFVSALVMQVWIICTGVNNFKQNIAHRYSACAVAANIAVLVVLAIASMTSATSGAEPTPTTQVGIITTQIGE